MDQKIYYTMTDMDFRFGPKIYYCDRLGCEVWTKIIYHTMTDVDFRFGPKIIL